VGNLAPVTFAITVVNPCSYLSPFRQDTTVSGALRTTDCSFSADTSQWYIDFYDLVTSGQQTLVITMQPAPAGALDPLALLFDLFTGNLAGVATGDAAPARLKAILTSSRYVVAASSLYSRQVGAYTLSSATVATTVAGCEEVWTSGGVAFAEAITSGDCAAAESGGTGTFYSDLLLFFLFGGQSLVVTQTSQAVDPYLVLSRLDDDSIRIVAQDDNSGGGTTARLSYTADSTTVYLLDVGTAAANQTGAYTLSIPPVSGHASGWSARARGSAARCAAANSVSYSGRHAAGMWARKYAAVITSPRGAAAAPYPTSITSPRKHVELPVSMAFTTRHSKWAKQSSSTGRPSRPSRCGTVASFSVARPLTKPRRCTRSS
jgi:hypothetical protein